MGQKIKLLGTKYKGLDGYRGLYFWNVRTSLTFPEGSNLGLINWAKDMWAFQMVLVVKNPPVN